MGPQHINLSGRVSGQSIHLFDRWLLLSALGLLLLGLLMVASSSIVISEKYFGQPFHYLFRQSSYAVLGLVIGLVVLRIDSRFWMKVSATLLLLVLVMLILVLIPGIGRTINGSNRWIGLGPIGLQVSELAKFAMILYMSSYLVRRVNEVQTQLSGFIKPLCVLGLVTLLLLKEPDFGAAVVITLTVLGMMFLAGVRLWQFALLFLVVLIMISVLAVSSPYRVARLTSFLNPWANQFDGGYQLTQSLIAFGRGGLMGTGLGESVQKLFYLPEAHTDFLFAVLAEELGLFGIAVVLILYTIVVVRGLMIARLAQSQERLFACYTAYGFSLWLAMQAFINIGVNSGLLPTKGLTLPLMSSGGSSMLVTCVVIAILLRIDHENRWQHLDLDYKKTSPLTV